MVGTISVSRTVINHRLGALSRASGFMVGVICLALLAFGTDALGFIPKPVLGGLLVYIGIGMLRDWLIVGRRTMPTTDFLQVLIIMLAIVLWDFLAGVGIGIVAACVTFAVNTSRIRPVRQSLDRSSFRSRVDRPIAHEETLHRHGGAIQVLWLHGFVFFGSAHRLMLDVLDLVAATGPRVCRSLILDFRQVLGIDSSAALSLGKLWNFAEREGIGIALSSVSPAIERTLRDNGLVGRDNAIARLFPDVDAALEWCEDELIAARISDVAELRSADEWLSHEFGRPDLFARTITYLRRVRFVAGDLIFDQGAEADCLYLLHSGRVTIVYTTPGGDSLRLRSMVGPTVLGEVGLYRCMPRSAAVRADEVCIVYCLTAEDLARMEAEDPAVAVAFHRFIVRVVSSRLDFANREIAGLTR
jgi:SulP family sulfate permease